MHSRNPSDFGIFSKLHRPKKCHSSLCLPKRTLTADGAAKWHTSSPTHLITDTPHRRHTSSPTHLITDTPHNRHTSSPTHLIIDTPHHRHTSSPTHLIIDTPHHRHTSSPTHQFRHQARQSPTRKCTGSKIYQQIWCSVIGGLQWASFSSVVCVLKINCFISYLGQWAILDHWWSTGPRKADRHCPGVYISQEPRPMDDWILNGGA